MLKYRGKSGNGNIREINVFITVQNITGNAFGTKEDCTSFASVCVCVYVSHMPLITTDTAS